MDSAFVIALLGAESTGKTTLAAELRAALAAPGRRVGLVGEYLREFCDQTGRMPRRDEQRAIAREQTRRIAESAARHDIVITDTSALMIAVYSDQVFGDTSLYIEASTAHAACRLTLLTALDLPWLPDLQRDGPHVRDPVDAKVRAALGTAGLPYSVIAGHGSARLRAALAAIERALNPPPDDADTDTAPGTRWRWHCDRCGDANCERHTLLPRQR